MDNNICVVGISNTELSNEQQKAIASCKYFFGAKRFQEFVPKKQLFSISPLEDALQEIKNVLPKGNIAVFASGDPLFYGIGKILLNHFSKENLCFFPALSSIQRAAALFKISWEDAHCVSLHGRSAFHLPSLFLLHNKTIALTDNKNTPNYIAQNLLDYLSQIDCLEESDKWQVFVAENIGGSSQNIFQGSLAQCAKQKFDNLNVVCLYRTIVEPFLEDKEISTFGLSESEISHSRGLITKREVRAATLHALRLPQQGVFWDIGAGSGSVSIEAGRINPQLRIFAIEHKKEEIENIKKNIRCYRSFSIMPTYGHAPEILETLPNPDRIFIGGSSGTLEENIAIAQKRLRKKGCIVINGVTSKTIKLAPKLLEKYGFLWESSTIIVERQVGDSKQKLNPITIITGILQNEERK